MAAITLNLGVWTGLNRRCDLVDEMMNGQLDLILAA